MEIKHLQLMHVYGYVVQCCSITKLGFSNCCCTVAVFNYDHKTSMPHPSSLLLPSEKLHAPSGGGKKRWIKIGEDKMHGCCAVIWKRVTLTCLISIYQLISTNHITFSKLFQTKYLFKNGEGISKEKQNKRNEMHDDFREMESWIKTEWNWKRETE